MTLSTSSRSRGRQRRPLALAALALVPLAVVGLFVGALSDASAGEARVPAAIVNNDEIVQQTAADGTESSVLAGRLLVTELTGASSGSAGSTPFEWQLTSTEKAEEALASGEIYAILTIPSNFSESIVSLSSTAPNTGALVITTDDSHGYLAGPISEAAADGLAAVFGDQISEQYIAGLVGGFGSVGESLTQAADGAGELADGAEGLGDGIAAVGSGTRDLGDGAGELGDGLHSLATGAGSAASGAGDLASGVEQYTEGVDSLSEGLDSLSDGAAGLSQLPEGVTQYTGGVTQSAEGLQQILDADPTINAQTRAALQQIADGLDTLSDSSAALITGAEGAAQVAGAIDEVATGADQLAAGSPQLVTGADSLTDGLESLADGASSAADGADGLADGAEQLADGSEELVDGADQLASGADELSEGLAEGAASVPSYTDGEVDRIAGVAASPISLTSTRLHRVDDLGQAVSTLLIPAGLWIGAIAVFLGLIRPARRLLASTASHSRLVAHRYLPAAAIGLVQAVLLVLLLHIGLGIDWGLLPATGAFSLLIALAFMAVHEFLTAAFGRAGIVISLVLLALQLTSSGGLYPVELVSGPFQAISGFLPLTAAVTGMQTLLTEGAVGAVFGSAVVLILFAAGSLLLSVLVTSRRRAAHGAAVSPELAGAIA